MTPRNDLAERLGLAPEDLFAPDASAPLAEPPRAHALTTSVRPMNLEAAYVPVPGLGTRWAQVYQDAQATQVILVELSPEASLVDTAGEVRRSGDEVLLDGWAGAAVRWRDPDGDHVLVAGEGTLDRLDLASSLPAAPTLDWPEVPEGLLATAPDWLAARAAPMLGAPTPFSRAAGVGAVGRLWTPSDPGAALEAALSGDLGPVGVARAWADALDLAVRSELAGLAALEIEACREALDRLSDAARDGRTEVAEAALAELVDRRDRVESVRWLLGTAVSDPLASRLDPLDREVRVRWSELPTGVGEAWTAQVRWQEPHAWWGQLP